MAGGLTISTLNDSSGVLATQNGMSGIAKAWVNFNSTPTIVGSFNVSSITKITTGTYTVNFTTAMPSNAYSVVGTVGYSTTSSGGIWMEINGTNNVTTTSVQVMARAGGGPYDCAGNYIAIFR